MSLRRCFWGVPVLLLLGGASPALGQGRSDSFVLTLVTGGHAAYLQAEASMKEALLAGAPGTRVFSVQLDDTRGMAMAMEALSSRPTLIVAVGSRAARLAREQARGTPLVYAMVLDPASIGLPGPGQAAGKVTGVTMDVTPEVQFELIQELVPGAHRIGVVYDPAISGEAVRRASSAAKARGLSLVAQAVRGESEVIPAAALLVPEVDVLWAVADPTVLTAANSRALILLSLRSRKPLFAVSEGFVRGGALAALAADAREVGRRAGELGARVLAGASPAALGPEAPPRLSLFVNLATAGHLRLSVPDAIVSRARTVYPRP